MVEWLDTFVVLVFVMASAGAPASRSDPPVVNDPSVQYMFVYGSLRPGEERCRGGFRVPVVLFLVCDCRFVNVCVLF